MRGSVRLRQDAKRSEVPGSDVCGWHGTRRDVLRLAAWGLAVPGAAATGHVVQDYAGRGRAATGGGLSS